MCGVWRDCRRIHHWCDGKAQIQSCCQASQDRVRGDGEASLEGVSALDSCQQRSRSSSSRRNTQDHLHFPGRVSHTASTALIDDASSTRMLLLFPEYLGAIGNDNPLTAFLTSYLDMVEIPLGLLRAAREGDWQLHLASIRAMIPRCFVYDKANYARLMSYYYATMSRLPIDHQEVHQQYMQGGSSVQLGSQNPFGRITLDQTIEETVNRGTQTAVGAKGFSLNRAAVERYYLTSEYRSVYLRQLIKNGWTWNESPQSPRPTHA